MKWLSYSKIILTIIVIAAIGANGCKHEPIPAPVHYKDTLISKSHVYIFKDTLSQGGGGNNHIPVYGSSGDTIKDSICFAEQILPLFESHCAKSGCHDNTTRKDGYSYTSYNNIRSYVTPGNTTAGKTLSTINSGKMPPSSSPPKFTTAQIALIKQWISQGAKNNIDCGFGCDTTTDFKYSTVISGIIATNCAGCHNSSSKGGGYDFSTYSGLIASITAGRLMGAINQQSGYYAMPVGSKLSACNIALIRQWINAGYPNN